MNDFELYRYTHPDGNAKDWAWCEQPGVGMEVRWGRAGRLAQKAVSPPSSRRAVIERALAKQRKGYRFVGWCRIDAAGRPFDVRARPADPSDEGMRPEPRAAVKAASGPVPDLSQIETGKDDYWF